MKKTILLIVGFILMWLGLQLYLARAWVFFIVFPAGMIVFIAGLPWKFNPVGIFLGLLLLVCTGVIFGQNFPSGSTPNLFAVVALMVGFFLILGSMPWPRKETPTLPISREPPPETEKEKKVIQKTTIMKEVIKIPCTNCGALIAFERVRCPYCGALQKKE